MIFSKYLHRLTAPVLLAASAALASACNGSPDEAGGMKVGAPRPYEKAVLMFNGDGTWTPEVESLRAILDERGVAYDEIGSAELDAMSVDKLASYGLLLWPGGSGGEQGNSFGIEAHANVRRAVQERGLSYLGFCAGSFLAYAPKAEVEGKATPYIGVVDGPIQEYYHLEGKIFPDFAMTMYTFADGSKRDVVWYGGPVTPELPGGVVARYPEGDPAITQTWSGEGFVMVVGGHPATPPAAKDSFGVTDSDGDDYDLTYQLIDATLKRQPMKAY